MRTAIKLAIIVLVCVIVFLLSRSASASSSNECDHYTTHAVHTQCVTARRAIYAIWSANAHDAMSVTACETGRTWNVWAGYPSNKYWGIFQMGPQERRDYGHGWNVWAQAKAAHRYFLRSGWNPWRSCI